MVQQFILGTQYIDELVMMWVKDEGDPYVYQSGKARCCPASLLPRSAGACVSRAYAMPGGGRFLLEIACACESRRA